MIWDNEQPCATCPYRRETARALWHKSEFENLLAADQDEIGAVFGCHMHRTEPKEQQRPCIGWLLDQKRRGLPSIALRMMFLKNADALALLDRVSETGLRLYSSIEEMIAANYPRGLRAQKKHGSARD